MCELKCRDWGSSRSALRRGINMNDETQLEGAPKVDMYECAGVGDGGRREGDCVCACACKLQVREHGECCTRAKEVWGRVERRMSSFELCTLRVL